MKTMDGSTSSSNIAPGLEAYIEWDGKHDGSTFVTKAAHQATAVNMNVASSGTFDYSVFKDEIDANRPVHLGLRTISPSTGEWSGHSVVGHGYDDDLFEVRIPNGTGYDNVTVGGFAVKDTWSSGTSQSSWYDWDNDVIVSVIDGDSVEWWPFIEHEGESWNAVWDWQVYRGTMLTVEAIPEPTTITFLAVVAAVLIRLRRRRG